MTAHRLGRAAPSTSKCLQKPNIRLDFCYFRSAVIAQWMNIEKQCKGSRKNIMARQWKEQKNNYNSRTKTPLINHTIRTGEEAFTVGVRFIHECPREEMLKSHSVKWTRRQWHLVSRRFVKCFRTESTEPMMLHNWIECRKLCSFQISCVFRLIMKRFIAVHTKLKNVSMSQDWFDQNY